MPVGGTVGYVSQAAPIEVVWEFGRGYGIEREQTNDIIDSMIGTNELAVDAADTIRKALRVSSNRGGSR